MVINLTVTALNVKAQDKSLPNPVTANLDFSELTLSKSFSNESIETTKTFSVSSNSSVLRFHLTGQVKSGIITVIIVQPNGIKSRTIAIDVTSEVDFKQTVDLKKNIKEVTGDWAIVIRTDNADGSYRLVINTR